MLSVLFDSFTDRSAGRHAVPAIAGYFNRQSAVESRRWASIGSVADTPELDWLGWDAWVRTEPPRLQRIAIPF